MYFVKAPTSMRKYNFEQFDDAINFAKAHSTKRSCYTVYNENKAIQTFANHQQIAQRTTLSYRQLDAAFNQTYYDIFCWLSGAGSDQAIEYPKIYHPGLYSIEISTVGDDAIRILWRYAILVLTTNKKIICRYDKISVTLHSNGRVFWNFRGKIRNSTAITVGQCGDLNEYEYNLVHHELCKLRPDISFVLDQCKEDFPNDITYLLVSFEYPNANYIIDTFRKTAVLRPRDACVGTDECRYFPRNALNENKCIEFVTHKLNIPCTPRLKRLYMANILNIDVVRCIVASGITDPNYIIRLFNYGDCDARSEITQEFIRLFVRSRGIKHVVRLLSSTSNYRGEIRDAAQMAQNVPPDILEYIFNNARTFHEIHDTLVAQTKRGCRENKYYTYSDTEVLRYEHDYGNITFRLPKSRKDLALIGAEMGICVGSYYPYIERRDCYIIKVAHNTEYIACIEVRNNHMVQLKAKFNNMVSIEYKPIIDRWLADSCIKPRTDDYNNIGHTPSYNHNFAMVRPEYFIDADDGRLRIIKNTNTLPGDYNQTWYKETFQGWDEYGRTE